LKDDEYDDDGFLAFASAVIRHAATMRTEVCCLCGRTRFVHTIDLFFGGNTHPFYELNQN